MARGKKTKTGKGNKGQNRALGAAYLEKQMNKPEVGFQNINGRDYPLRHSNPMKSLNMVVHFPMGAKFGWI